MNINPIVLSIPIYFLLIGVELVIQFISKRKLYRFSDALTNISCGITQQLTGLFLKVLSISIYVWVYESLRIFTIPNHWISITLLFFAVDFCYYWAHRMSHEINLFWGGHVVHHQSEDYNFSVALRQGSFQVLWTFFFYLPLALAGFDPVVFVLISALNTVYQFWIHTETIGRLGPLEWIFNTPSHHRVHHGRNPKYIDKNHAGVFIIWDKLFGTFQVEEETPTYGITTPTNSWNPVWVNLKHYVLLAGWVKQARTFSDRLGILFNKPGWFPEYMGGYQPAPDVDKDHYVKYNRTSSLAVNRYVLVQYLLALAATAFFLFNVSNFDLLMQVTLIMSIILTITNCGGLMDGKNWAILLEYFRLIGMAILIFILTFDSENLLVTYLSEALVLILILWFIKVSRKTSP